MVEVAWEVDRLTAVQRRVLTWDPPPGTRQATVAVLSVSFGTAKCVQAGTLVTTDRGVWPIESLVPDRPPDQVDDDGGRWWRLECGPQVPTHRGRWRRATHAYSGGAKPCWRLTTRRGAQLTGTAEHRVRVATEDGPAWRRLADLQPGDWVEEMSADRVRWDRVEAVEDAGSREVYDLTVEDDHSYVAEGLITHNTTAAMLRFLRVCMEHPPWQLGDRRRQPLALALAPTYPLLKINVLDLFDYLCPREVILRRVRSPPQSVTLANGVRIVFMSADGAVDSGNAFAILADEVSYPVFLDGSKWRKIVGRLRYASYRELIVTGIASSSNPILKERFHQPDDPTMLTVLPGLDDSPIDEEAKANILATLPHELCEVARQGGWAPDRQQVYQLDRELHCYEGEIDRTAPTRLSIDPGRSAVVAVWQMLDDVLVCVDEIIAYDVNTEGLCREARDRGWENVQQVTFDPNASLDAKPLVRKVYPAAQMPIVQKRSAEWFVAAGIERVKTALRDATGAVRLKFADYLWDEGHPRRGVVRSMMEYRYDQRGRPVRDNRTDHQVDVVRLAVLQWIREAPPRASRRKVVALR